MTVAELIEVLQRQPQKADMKIMSVDGCLALDFDEDDILITTDETVLMITMR